MDSKIIVPLVVGILIGGASIYGWAYTFYPPQIESLRSSRETLQQDFQNLSVRYQSLVGEKDSLNSQYLSLQGDYRQLSSNYNESVSSFNEAVGHLHELSDEFIVYKNDLDRYFILTDSFQRTLTLAEIEKVGGTVRPLTSGSSYFWYNLGRIYDYVVNNIKYTYDPEMPYITGYYYVNYEGRNTVVNFTVGNYQNYVQTPEFTLKYKQGDCEDQAILEYAMNYYYMKNVYGTLYDMYLIQMAFSDNTGHVAMILPVQGGMICVMDPAGRYLTSEYGVITSKTTSTEMTAYESYLRASHGSVLNVKLYRINVSDGSYKKLVDGTFADLANFLK